MAATLGWDGAVLAHTYGAGLVARHGDRDPRPMTEPAQTITAGSKGSGPRLEWRFRTDRIAAPGHRDRAGGERQHANSIRVSLVEAAVLQGFRADYPWAGGKGKQFEQVGNAVPPPLAAAIVAAAAGITTQIVAAA